MQTPNNCQARCRRQADKGAILMVVLIVMIALLGLGMTGLFLTSGSIQMNTNINLRNQALVVAEAGIERARGILNNRTAGWVPPVPDLLVGSITSADEVPTTPAQCQGSARGAILVDQITASCATAPTTGCRLQDVAYPSLDRTADLPPFPLAGPIARPTLGTYTVFIRQDQADCRMGNYTCEYAPANGPGGVDGGAGAGGAGGTNGNTTCTVPTNVPAPNGSVVVRSEGLASDGKTRVVLEVTMTPSLGAAQAANTPISALCAAGANGCDDNSSVQNGIVVNSNTTQTPPSNGGTTGNGGAGGAAGAGGSPGTGGTQVSFPPSSGGAVGTGGLVGTGGHGTGGHGTGGSGSGGSTGCVPSVCPSLATIGLTGLQPATNFIKWLATLSSTCMAQSLDTQNLIITDAYPAPPGYVSIAPYKVIIVLDVNHVAADYTQYASDLANPKGGPYLAAQNFTALDPAVRLFSAAEGQAVKRWVMNNAGGLLVTQGYADGLAVIGNFNTLVEPLGLVYYSSYCGLNSSCATAFWEQDAYGNCNNNYGNVIINSFAVHPVTAGMTQLYAAGWWPISGYPTGSGFPTTPTALPSGYQVLATYPSCLNINTGKTFSNLSFMVAGSFGSGRVLALADEWLTYDQNLGSSSYGATATAFWKNAMTWLGQCQ